MDEKTIRILENVLRPHRVFILESGSICIPNIMQGKPGQGDVVTRKMTSSEERDYWNQPEMEEAWKEFRKAAELLASAPSRAAKRIIEEGE